MTTPALEKPLTGEEYLESLRDGREVWIGGEKVADVTEHPAFRNATRSVARLYDALHDPANDMLTTDRRGILTHKFFAPAYSSEDLVDARDALALWSRMSYGFMGRSPDYKASFMAGLGADPAWYGDFASSAEHWYRKYAEGALFLNHVLINPPIDRSKAVHDMEDVFVHVVEERDGGMVVSGAKMLATGSALTHATFVAQNSATQLEKGKAEDYALVFIAPLDTPGQKLLSRRSYEATADSPFDHPLSSRFDENDAVIVFDNAFIPWENVLVYRDVEKATGFYAQSGFLNRYTLQAGTRLAVKLDFLTGLISRALETNGTDGFRGVQAELGELFGWRSLMWSITTALCHDTRPGPGESVVPNADVAMLVRLFGSMAAPRFNEIAAQILGGSPLLVPSSVEDMKSAELRPLIDRFYRGSSGSAEERIKLFKLIWDAMGSEFGARHEWYERNYGGSAELVRLDALRFGTRGGELAKCQAMVEQCMSDYDLDGWTGDTWT
ncbi:MAG: paerucumarin biosynthesis protein PvcC [Solirubrobacteraceae bacterium]|jgi:4-hydroxyphenylacetate 3-monooxygenase|nr:paerucumarin biosynthesis protein PvcC [Solirubrobacteraceae bacterium]